MRLPLHIYHLAEASNWPSIQRDGLHSASTLFTKSGLTAGPERDCLERRQRRTHIQLPNPRFHVRHQLPMPPQALERCLVGMAPEDWYALINSHVFFWIDPERLNRQRKASEPRPQVVLTIDAMKLIKDFEDHVRLTPFNTGNAKRKAAIRGTCTFVPLTTWKVSKWDTEAKELGTKRRPRSHKPVEVAIDCSIPNFMKYVVKTQELAPGQLFEPDD